MIDYIVVGFGLAGVHVSHSLQQLDKSFVVFDPLKENASKVAGGVNSPLILKRYTTAWRAEELIPEAENTYKEIEKILGIKLFKSIPIYRKINSIKEQNDWFVALDKPGLEQYMSPSLKNIPQIKSDFGFGEIYHSNIVETELLINSYAQHLIDTKRLHSENFEYSQISFEENHITYKEIKAKKIIFCEGIGISNNPYFENIPIKGNKGEYLIIKAPLLKIDFILKSTFTLIPLGKDRYKFGATYDRVFQNDKPEAKNRELLINKLDKLINCPYEIEKVVTGIRPTVRDFRPVMGQHPKNSKLLICNGFGSHGVMMASSMANQLMNAELNITPLSPEINVNRFVGD